MRIAFVGPQGLDVVGTSPWTSLLEGLGVFHEISSVDHAQGMVIVNHQWAPLRVAKRRGIPAKNLAMVMLEPDATLPEHGSKRLMRHYGLVLCGSPRWASRVGGEPFPWPQALEDRRGGVTLDSSFRYRATLVAGQKRSGMESSQYGLRRETLRSCARLGVSVGLAGPGWTDPPMKQLVRASAASARALTFKPGRYSLTEAFGRIRLKGIDYVGPVADKFAFMRQAPIAIIVENSPDYISEKLIDAVSAGVAPVFIGPPLQEFGLPGAIAISVDPDPDAIASTLERLSRSEIERCIRAGQEWLTSPGATEWEAERVFERIGMRLGAYFAEST